MTWAREPKPGHHTSGKFRLRKLFLAGVLWLTGEGNLAQRRDRLGGHELDWTRDQKNGAEQEIFGQTGP
jgi:hypothetical protein